MRSPSIFSRFSTRKNNRRFGLWPRRHSDSGRPETHYCAVEPLENRWMMTTVNATVTGDVLEGQTESFEISTGEFLA